MSMIEVTRHFGADVLTRVAETLDFLNHRADELGVGFHGKFDVFDDDDAPIGLIEFCEGTGRWMFAVTLWADEQLLAEEAA